MNSFVQLFLPAWAASFVCALQFEPTASAADSKTPPPPRSKTVLGIQESRFTLDDKPVFLLGCSYYGGLGASEEFVRRDLDDLGRLGFNWVRLWATWGGMGEVVSAVDAQGGSRAPFFSKLKWFVAECDGRGIIVDVTLARRESERPEAAGGMLPNAQAHQRAVETIVRALRPHRNWYLDLANERDVRDARYVSPEELRGLRDVVRKLDPDRLVTASFGGHDLEEKDLRQTLETVGADFLAPHRPRHAASPGQTEEQTRACLALMKRIGRVAPVQHQEPFRRGYTGWEPKAADFLQDLRGAVAGGAAGWCFHNGTQRGAPEDRPRRSFDLSTQRLFDQLDSEERRFLEQAGGAVSGQRASPD